MLERTERISFRISYVLSKVEPGVGVGSATLHVCYYSIRTHNSIQTASWVMWWYSKLLCPTKSPFFVTLIYQQYQYFYNNLVWYFLIICSWWVAVQWTSIIHFYFQPSLGENVSAAEGIKETELDLEEEILTENHQPADPESCREETAVSKR